MAFKQFALDERTSVTIYKRKSSRSLRLSIAPDGTIRVSMPVWAPYSAGLRFAKSRRGWITKQHRPSRELVPGQAVGKAHRLRFEQTDVAKITSRLRQNEVIIYHPVTLKSSDPKVQQAAKTAGVRALRRQAEALLPQRLASLAAQHGFTYNEVAIKQLKSRWGSCDQHGNIVLNLFLMQLPWDCIDYVMLHELTHTKIMRHGPDFWHGMEEVMPNVKQMRKIMRDHQPILRGSPQLVA